VVDLDDGGGPDLGPLVIPADQYLGLGDNRGNRRDGRFFGLVDRSAILGRAAGICLRDGAVTWQSLLSSGRALGRERARNARERGDPMGLVYYYSPMSTANRTTWALEELGIEYEKKKLDFRAGDTHKPELAALNPNEKVPVLVIDGTPIFESTAILLHLGETYGVEKGLFPAPGLARAETFQWIVWAQATLIDAIQGYVSLTSERVPEELRNAKAGAIAKEKLEKTLAILDAVLAKREWLVGDHFSFADLAVASYLPYLRFLGYDTSAWKHIGAWFGRCNARPAAQRVMSV
jgi:glutathione S-transferase